MKLAVFGIMNFIVFLTNTWLTLDINKILVENLNVKESDISSVASVLFSSFFYGLLLSSFIWPPCVSKFPKFFCIISSFIILGLINWSCFYITNIYYIIFTRFLAGTFQNIHTVGKDYLFDQFSEDYAKTGLIIDSCFGLLGTFLIYSLICNRSFNSACDRALVVYTLGQVL
jgi:MFS family permease